MGPALDRGPVISEIINNYFGSVVSKATQVVLDEKLATIWANIKAVQGQYSDVRTGGRNLSMLRPFFIVHRAIQKMLLCAVERQFQRPNYF